MPEVEYFEYLLTWLDELGIVGQGMAGAIPLSFSEIVSWTEVTGNELTHWELSMLARLSKQYCYQSYTSDKKECESPFTMVITEEDMAAMRAIADKKLRDMI